MLEQEWGEFMAQDMLKRPRIRVAVAIVEDGKLLLVEHAKGQRRYWLLPGGGVEWGEESRVAACRELAEETGVEAEIGHLILASETVAPDGSRHLLHLVFSGRRLRSKSVPRLMEERITDVRWVPLEQVGELTFHPPIGKQLVALGRVGLAYQPQDPIFLGNLWID